MDAVLELVNDSKWPSFAAPGQAGVAIELKYPLRPPPFLLLLLLVIVIVIVLGLRLNLFFPVFW
jgi:hypothetical protein